MDETSLRNIFTSDILKEIFPPERANDFFEALFGDADEGSYDIALAFDGCPDGKQNLLFALELKERPGCCLVCNLTYGLPDVFSRHPVINVQGVVAEIEKRLDTDIRCVDWRLGGTEQQSSELHRIPLIITIKG